MSTPITNPSTDTQTAAPTWVFDAAHSAVEFSAKHMMLSTVRGRFNTIDVKLNLDENDLTRSSVEVTIDAASLETNDTRRNEHLHSADFLHVEQHPNITFQSKRIEHTGGDRFRVVGDLTIRDVTREVVLDTTLEGRGVNPWGKEVMAF